ncbi:hypothetical protein CEQ90_01315 [Lewinellaceae bacterium SD302]|nr:hypothetical protein CEQ90_01315 [Lewinellaceae bacterium SD302]
MKNLKQTLLFLSFILVFTASSFTSLYGQGGDCLNIDVLGAECDPNSPGWFATISVFPTNPDTCDVWFGSDGFVGQMNQPYQIGPFTNQVVTYFASCNANSDSCFASVVISAPPTFPCPANSCGINFGGITDTTFAVCNVSTGSVTFSLSGDGDYNIETYDENNMLVSVTANSPTVENLPGGEYGFLIVCDDGDVIAESSVWIGEDPGFQAGIEIESDNCSDYTLTATPNDPANYTYVWSTNETTAVINVPGGTFYRVTVTDANGCESAWSTNFLQNGSFEVEVFSFDETCDNGNGGASVFIPNGNQQQFSYAWPNGDDGTFSFGYSAGSYEVTVTSPGGCEVITPFVIESDGLFFQHSMIEYLCLGETTLQVFDGDSTAGNTILWTFEDGTVVGDDVSVVVTQPGEYTVFIADETDPDCNYTGTITVVEGQINQDETAIVLESYSDTINQGCGQYLIHRNFTTGNNDYSLWEVPGQEFPAYGWSIDPANYGPGLYVATTFSNDSICPSVDSFVLLEEDLICIDVSGLVYLNFDDNCDLEAGDFPLEYQLLIFSNLTNGEVYFGYANHLGEYSISLPAGSYSVDLGGDNELLELCAPVGFTLIDGIPLTDENVPVSGTFDCPRVTVDVTVPLLRRCFNNGIYINYENTGTVIADDVVISVEVGDFASQVSSWFGTAPDDISTDPVTGITTVTFNVGDLDPFEGGTFYLQVFSCSNDFPLGAAGCITATAAPNNPCPPADPDWNGASLRVNGTCDGNEVTFDVTNVGDAPTSSVLSYVVIEDGVLLSPNPIQTDSVIDAGETQSFTFPANGATYHFQVEQEPLHPGLEMPIDFVEACADGQQVSYGFALQFPLSDDAYWIDEECNELIGAYDPNDKRAMPRGYSDDRLIEAGQMLDYTIRFQNTGTDTAFTVIVRDTLSDVFELSTLEITGSTHSMRPVIDSSGHSLAFVFENILLVDSFTNEPASHGAVNFRIQAREDLEPGTDVDNNASIYFDFNEPVVTNTYHLQIDEDFVTVGAFDFTPKVSQLRVFPNPTAGLATIQLPEALKGQTLQLEAYDMLGRRQMNFSYRTGDTPQADLSQLPAGWYNLRLSSSNGQVLGNGRVLLQR